MAKRFLYVRTASDDAACINCDVITDLALDGSGSLHIGFTTDDNSTAGVIECTVNTSDVNEADILKKVAHAICRSSQSVIVLRDDVTGEGFDNITAVGTITPSS